MSKIMVLRSNFEGTDWKRAFAETLMLLRPDMNPDAADEVSDAELLITRDVEPSLAARRWVARQGTPDAPQASQAGQSATCG